MLAHLVEVATRINHATEYLQAADLQLASFMPFTAAPDLLPPMVQMVAPRAVDPLSDQVAVHSVAPLVAADMVDSFLRPTVILSTANRARDLVVQMTVDPLAFQAMGDRLVVGNVSTAAVHATDYSTVRRSTEAAGTAFTLCDEVQAVDETSSTRWNPLRLSRLPRRQSILVPHSPG